jgi:hypothetical protein
VLTDHGALVVLNTFVPFACSDDSSQRLMRLDPCNHCAVPRYTTQLTLTCNRFVVLITAGS